MLGITINIVIFNNLVQINTIAFTGIQKLNSYIVPFLPPSFMLLYKLHLNALYSYQNNYNYYFVWLSFISDRTKENQ